MSAPATILAFDFGQRRIGVAVGQSVTGSASPLGVIANRDTGVDHDALAKLIREWRPGLLVVGMPTHADGSPSEMQVPVLELVEHRLNGIVVLRERLAYTSRQPGVSDQVAQTFTGQRKMPGTGVDPGLRIRRIT